MSPFVVFFFNDTATTEIYTLSLHDALPISTSMVEVAPVAPGPLAVALDWPNWVDRKSTRLNSSHLVISYAVFCLKIIILTLKRPVRVLLLVLSLKRVEYLLTGRCNLSMLPL